MHREILLMKAESPQKVAGLLTPELVACHRVSMKCLHVLKTSFHQCQFLHTCNCLSQIKERIAIFLDHTWGGGGKGHYYMCL